MDRRCSKSGGAGSLTQERQRDKKNAPLHTEQGDHEIHRYR